MDHNVLIQLEKYALSEQILKAEKESKKMKKYWELRLRATEMKYTAKMNIWKARHIASSSAAIDSEDPDFESMSDIEDEEH